MPENLLPPELRAALRATHSKSMIYRKGVKTRRKENIEAFLAIDRTGLRHESIEQRILLYTTLQDEKIFIQLPGKESERSTPMPYDFRPKIECADGSQTSDATFEDIWEVLEKIGRIHNGYLCYVAALFFRMGYMYDYIKTHSYYDCSTLQMEEGRVFNIQSCTPLELSWYHINLSENVWHTLNSCIGNVAISPKQRISFEAFIKYMDLLLQNEDCKYYYKKAILGGDESYNLANGRASTCNSGLFVIDYLKGRNSFSTLLGGFKYGVAKYSPDDYHIVTEDIVTYI